MQWQVVPAQELHRVDFYAHDWHSTNHLELAHVSGLQTVLTLQTTVDDLECKLEIDCHWNPNNAEWKRWDHYIAQHDYYRAIDVLEGLVVSRLFELTKMNQSETGKSAHLCGCSRVNCGSSGYKLRTKIANALRARSAAIRIAIKCYNEAATNLAELQPPLDMKTVLDYVFLAEFDLLRGSRHNLQDKPCSQLAERLAMNTWFKI